MVFLVGLNWVGLAGGSSADVAFKQGGLELEELPQKLLHQARQASPISVCETRERLLHVGADAHRKNGTKRPEKFAR
jgi:hypothetical protein